MLPNIKALNFVKAFATYIILAFLLTQGDVIQVLC